MSNTSCNACEKPLKSTERVVCTQLDCKKPFHYQCVQLTSKNFKKQLSWKCPDCVIGLLSTKRRAKNDDTPCKALTSVSGSNSPDEQQTVPVAGGRCVTTSDDEEKSTDLQSTIRNIIHKELRQIIREVFSAEFEKLSKELRDFGESLNFMNDQFEELKANVKACAEENKGFRTETDILKRKVKDLESRLSIMEQDSRQSNIEIHCLPEHRQENLINTVIQIGKVVSCPVSEADILVCNRVQKLNRDSKMPKTVICKLANKLKRDNLLASVYKYNKSHPKDKLNSKHLGLGDRESPVFINEHLTPANKSLHAATRIWAKEKQYKYVWVRNGKIFVRRDNEQPARIILHEDTLKALG